MTLCGSSDPAHGNESLHGSCDVICRGLHADGSIVVRAHSKIDTLNTQQRLSLPRWLWDLQEKKAFILVIECGGGLAIPSVRVQGEDAVDGAGEASLLVRLNPKATDCKAQTLKHDDRARSRRMKRRKHI